MAKAPIPPSKEQDGYAYIRVEKVGRTEDGFQIYDCSGVHGQQTKWGHDLPGYSVFTYDDDDYGQRVISSRKVEQAVMIAEYIALCCQQGFAIGFYNGTWTISDFDYLCVVNGQSLRDCYWRLMNKLGRQ